MPMNKAPPKPAAEVLRKFIRFSLNIQVSEVGTTRAARSVNERLREQAVVIHVKQHLCRNRPTFTARAQGCAMMQAATAASTTEQKSDFL